MGHAFLMFDRSETRHRLNSSAMHALAVIEECHGNVAAAKELVNLQLQSCSDRDFTHWVQVLKVLSGESGGKS